MRGAVRSWGHRCRRLGGKPAGGPEAERTERQRYRLLGAQAPLHGREFSDLETAEAWLEAFHLGAR